MTRLVRWLYARVTQPDTPIGSFPVDMDFMLGHRTGLGSRLGTRYSMEEF